MNRLTRFAPLALLCSWLLSGPASAEDVRVLTGGIGAAEREALAEAEKDYSLKLELATTQGFYIANAHVIVWDVSGDMVVEATAEGPLVLIDLPAATYDVTVIYQGEEKKKRVSVRDGKARKLVFVWKVDEQ